MSGTPSERREASELAWVDIPIALPAIGESDVFRVGHLELLLCNAEGTPYVLHDECPHVRTSMKGAQIRGTILECPMHGGLMDVRDGSPKGMPIRRQGVCFPVRRAESNAGWQVGLPSKEAGSRSSKCTI